MLPLVLLTFIALGMFVAAASSFAQSTQALSPATDSMEAHYAAARDSLLHSDYRRATTETNAFLAEALHRVANARAQTGELSLAVESFGEALRFAPNDANLLADFGSVRFDQSQLPEAESWLSSALEKAPANPRVRFLLGRVLFSEDKYLAAKPHLDFAFSAGRREDIWYLLAVTDLKLQQLSAAREVFSKMVAVLGNRARTHFRFGLAYYYGDYPDEAIAEFKKAIALDASVPDQHYYLGLAHLGHNPQAGFSSATPEFRAELSVDPNDFRSHFMLGYIALKQRDLHVADREISRAVSMKPDDVNALILFSELQIELGAQARAEELLRKAIALSPDSPSPSYEIVRAHYLLGRILLRAGRKEEAAKELQISECLRLLLRPNSGATLEERSSTGAQKKQPAELQERAPSVSASAEDRARATEFVHRLSPLIADAYNNLGVIAASRSEFCEAAASFRTAQIWDPSLEELSSNLSRASTLCGKKEQP